MGNSVEFASAPDTVIDFYADCAWSERFTREEMENRRKETRTINEWDSQYQLHSKPVGDVDSILTVFVNTTSSHRSAMRTARPLWLGNVQIVGAVAWWDVATGKVKADASAFL
jgi:hypothetical protein